MVAVSPVERIVLNYRDSHRIAKDALRDVREPRGVEDDRYAAARYLVGVEMGLRMAASYMGVPAEVLDASA